MVNTDNTKVTFKGSKLTLKGKAVKVGDVMPSFTLTAQDMSDLKSDSLRDHVLIIAPVPSLDTPVCAVETKRFEQTAANLSPVVKILAVSHDLPFALKRWCGAEGVSKVTAASDFKYRSFGTAFGVQIEEWGLLSRAVFVVDTGVGNTGGKIAHVEYVPDISQEPDYEAALKVVSSLVEK